ncbi:MAG: glycoside hydrolase family 31 protein [Rikenellaceae bacterium]
MRYKLLALVFMSLCSSVVTAQKHSVIPILDGEKWYGAITAFGSRAPFTKDIPKQSLSTDNYNNQTSPFMVSSAGRYIYSDMPFDFEFKGGNIIIDSPSEEVVPTAGGKTLKEAFLAARNAHFKGSGTIPDKIFFEKAQYNTWIELMYNQNQKDIEAYADAIIANKFSPGILMIDDNWQRYYGNFDFRAEKFSDPKAMIKKLHDQGFKVMLWVCPFVSSDSEEFRNLEKKGYLIKEKGSNNAAIIRWWNGYSACYDLTNPAAFDSLVQTLKGVQEKYGVDGFKFDAGDPTFYNPLVQDYYDKNAVSNDHTMKWSELGLYFPYNEYRATWKMQGEALVQRLGDKDKSWNALNLLIPEMLNAGLIGYSYTCPDMIGGGQFSAYLNIDQTKIDQELIVRSAQVHAFMPMMQFSVAPWRILDDEHLKCCHIAAELHENLKHYIIEMANHSASTGEPIVRSMEYQFPGEGFSECMDQFMLGDKYLVAPILSKGGRRTVALPAGKWEDDMGVTYKGGKSVEIEASIDRIPYFQKRK